MPVKSLLRRPREGGNDGGKSRLKRVLKIGGGVAVALVALDLIAVAATAVIASGVLTR